MNCQIYIKLRPFLNLKTNVVEQFSITTFIGAFWRILDQFCSMF